MAARGPSTAQSRPDMGDTLMVIHDFIARSSDELSLSKGDRVELVERDDEFGDGWFLGRHLGNGNTGLFPEVYTRPAPKATATPTHPSATPLSPLPEVTHDATPSSPAQQEEKKTETPSKPGHSTPKTEDTPVTLPLSSAKPDSLAPSPAVKQGPEGLARLNNPSQDSQVLNETLNVINEHITNLRSPASSSALPSIAPDSSSEYSAPLDRLSYIHGEETDEEEEGAHTRLEVESWTPDQVAEHLFTSGVEKHHCEVFRDQEISGEVLLGMDQSSLFIKAFDLGSVGRRLKTWHKIKSLQDEVNGIATRRTTRGSDRSSDMTPRTRGRTSTVTSATTNPPMTIQTQRLSINHTPPALTPNSTTTQDSSLHSGHHKRPSAASVRDLHHSRRHSSTDYHLNAGSTPRLASNGTFPGAVDPMPHKKQPSFDRNWNLGSAFAQTTSPRPISSAGARGIAGGSDVDIQEPAVDLERGYFSGTDADGRTRTNLRKRDSAARSNRGSYAEEQRVRSATALSRHSRYGSVDSYREGAQSAAQKYFGAQPGLHRRTTSTNAPAPESPRISTSVKDNPSPTVTRLDTSRGSDSSKGPPTPAKDSDWLSSLINKPMSKSGGFGMRAISDNLSFDRSKASSVDFKDKDPSITSPTRTGSTTPSGGASLELESPDMTKSPGATNTPASRNRGRKTKKETSAYTKGLLKISPKEAIKDADYSGWMRKKSSNLMTTWKPRFFVLKGRRLSYYYSEDDDSEKGLIDISFHRVLPADNEKLTGLHATITGASLTSPTPDGDEPVEKGDDAIFIFKLTPPRAGLSRAVHFTKPTVHYFAVPNLKQGRLWMAAMMKATIDRDDSQPVTSTYQHKIISLAKAKQMRHRPPALMGLEEAAGEDGQRNEGRKDSNGLGIFSEADSGVAGMEKGKAQRTSEEEAEQSVLLP
ncbi:unnamed protein product [Clonostachys chloroleuca]|uniref:Protein BOI2 n=1 Tax=Clonostachys chloroleuca TaxID=1926264 RepID=A0AA35PY54_9HYPO|nr:unnamed protein product [Clonostachys chloroleuca]